MRLSVKGWPSLVKIGYRVPQSVRGLHPSGYRDVLVHNLVELETLSRETDAARIASGVGRRKRIEIARRAKELGIRILNGRGLLVGEVAEGKPKEAREEEVVAGEAKERAGVREREHPKKRKRAKKTKGKKKPAKKKKSTSSRRKTKKKSSEE